MRYLLTAIVLCALGLTVVPVSGEANKAPVAPVANLVTTSLMIAQTLQDTSVTVRAADGTGSGSLVRTKDGSTWVLTAAHVIDGNRVTRESSTTKRTVVTFNDVKIYIAKNRDGRKVSENFMDAEILRYSDAEHGHDLALLRIRDDDFMPKASTVFYLDKELPPIATELYHCGSLLGQFGSNSLTGGLLSQHGRLLVGKVFDQTTCTAFPGSSGGPVVLKSDGRYIGMLVRGAGEGFNLTVPIRRIREWTKKVGVEFVLDPALPVPSLDEIRKTQIDDDDRGTPVKTEPKSSNTEMP